MCGLVFKINQATGFQIVLPSNNISRINEALSFFQLIFHVNRIKILISSLITKDT